MCTALMSPMEPMEMRSSASTPLRTYFLAMWAARRRLWAMSVSAAAASPFASASMSGLSCSGVRGLGKELFPARCKSSRQAFWLSQKRLSRSIAHPSFKGVCSVYALRRIKRAGCGRLHFRIVKT